ncbi:MAG: phospholipase D-like domain-containing protein [Gemmatimonadota bacterium]|nr:phospholipase D-like domain-containing protein [Gemmatimonadota bacterium]
MSTVALPEEVRPVAPATPHEPMPPREAWALACKLPDGVCDVGFRPLIHEIDAAPMHGCAPTQLLTDGEEAFRIIGEACKAAREEILVETYILRDDRIGLTLLQQLADAVKRGVRVHVLADGIGSLGTGRKYWRDLEAAGISVRLFHPWWRAPLHAMRRDHRKIFVFDREIAFTGGMNIGIEYGSSIRTKGNNTAWRDTFIRVEGDVSLELAAVFAEGWDRAGGPALPGLSYVSWSEGIVQPPRGFAALRSPQLRARVKRRLALRQDRKRGRRVQRAEPAVVPLQHDAVMVLDSRPGRGQPETIGVLSALWGAARSRLWVTTPYFAPPLGALDVLEDAVKRGVDVRLLLPGKSDIAFIRHAAHGTYAKLLRAGVRIFEYQPAILHAKTMVVDGQVGVVGSANLDFRSLWLNAECNLLLFNHETAAALEAAFTKDLGTSVEITAEMWKQRGWKHRLLDAVALRMRWAL